MPVGQSTLTRDILKVKVRSVHAGVLAPDFDVTALDGKPLKLSELRGKLVLLDFWATWCGPCVARLPDIRKLHNKFAADGFTVVGISFDRDADTARKFADTKQLNWPQVWADKADKGPLANLYGVGGVPATFLIGPDGKVIEGDLDGEELVKAIEREMKKLKKAKGEASPAVTETTTQAAPFTFQPPELSPATHPAEPPEARALLEVTATSYRTLRSYADTFRYEARVVHKGDPEPELGYIEGTLLFAAPDHLLSKSDTLHVYCDGERLTHYLPASRQYTVDEGTDGLHDLVLGGPVSSNDGGFGLHPLACLLANAEVPAADALLITAVTGVTAETRDGRAGQLLSGYMSLPMAPGDGEAPFTAFINDKTQFFEEILLDMTEMARAAASADDDEAPEVERAELVLTFSDVEADTEAPATAFTFDPAGARKVEAFGYRPQPVVSPLDLLGRHAPALAGAALDGPAFDLAARNRSVAVVAFWGTWSPQAARLLADLQHLADRHPRYPLVVVGVNRNGVEGEPAVRQLLADSGAQFRQVLDRTGKLAEAWHVAALPTVFLVNTDGVIAEVCPLWSEETGENVGRQIETLLNSGSLYTAKEAAALRGQARDYDKNSGLRLQLPNEESANERLEAAETQELTASTWNVAEQDVDGDGEPELILPSWQGDLSIVKPLTGEIRRVHLHSPQQASTTAVQGIRIDGDVCWLWTGSLYSMSSGGGAQQRAVVRLHAPSGEILWTFSPPVAEKTYSEARAVAGDLDGDGVPEYAIGLTTYVQERIDEQSFTVQDMRGRLIVLDRQGRLIAQRDLPDRIGLLHIPRAPAGQPAPLACLTGGQLERYMLLPAEPAENDPAE